MSPERVSDELMTRQGRDLTTGFQGGELVGHIREYSDSVGIFLLESRRRHIYGDRQVIEMVSPAVILMPRPRRRYDRWRIITAAI